MQPHTYALQLNADWTPMGILPVLPRATRDGRRKRRLTCAAELLFEDKIYTLVPSPGKFLRSPALVLPWPSVVVRRRRVQSRPRVKFNSRNVILRDCGQCAYCGNRPRRPDGSIDLTALDMDHVIPRGQARDGLVFLPWSRKWVGVHCWENAATSCRSCNGRKGCRTPAQAGLALRTVPRNPTVYDVLRIALSRLRELPPEWRAYLPEIPRLYGDADEVQDNADELETLSA